MKFVTYAPCNSLMPYVKHFIISENSEAQTYKVLPGTALVMGFQYAGRLSYKHNDQDIRLATAGITGLMDSFRVFENTAGIGTVLVVFKETGVASFLKQPVNELFGESLSLDHFFNREQLVEVQEKLSVTKGDQHRINIIEKLLLDHLFERSSDTLVDNAIIQIKQSNGTIRIAELAKQLNVSQGPLEKRFRRVVGASPKKFAAIVRNNYITAALVQHNYADAVFLAGYYDQAHLIKDFKTFTGTTPEQFIKDKQQS